VGTDSAESYELPRTHATARCAVYRIGKRSYRSGGNRTNPRQTEHFRLAKEKVASSNLVFRSFYAFLIAINNQSPTMGGFRAFWPRGIVGENGRFCVIRVGTCFHPSHLRRRWLQAERKSHNHGPRLRIYSLSGKGKMKPPSHILRGFDSGASGIYSDLSPTLEAP
jgi:hypothetical protein